MFAEHLEASILTRWECQAPFAAALALAANIFGRLVVDGYWAISPKGIQMSRFFSLMAAGMVSISASAALPAEPSSYVGQHGRAIKALSPEEVQALLGGQGMGFAKAAELNGYPGPSHVLELAEALALTPAQTASTEALFSGMQTRAKSLGAALVDQERALDDLFAGRAATVQMLNRSLDEIAQLRSALRAVHLEAHLAQADVLTDEQNKRYQHLRGYTATESSHVHSR